MTRGRKKKRLSTRARIFAVGIIVALGSFAVLAFAEKLTPEEGLRRIREKESVGSDYDTALQSSLTAIQKNELTDLWGRVTLARKLDTAGEKQLALELLQAVTAKIEKANSGASFEANLLLSRLRLEVGQRIRFESLEKQLELYRRKDLEAENLYSLGLSYLQKKEVEVAQKAFISLRERYPTSPFSKSARMLKELTVSKPELREIELLIKEGDVSAAELELASYQKLFPSDSPQLFESLLTRETLLRKQKKPAEADELLLVIAADAPEPSGSTALFRSAKNAWNENDSLRALELLDQLFRRFPKSTLLPDAHYTEARILEELGKLREAERKYEEPIQLLEKSAQDVKETQRLTKSVKRAVWLKFARGDYEGAIKLSERALKILEPLSSDGELRSEANGLNYWIARSLLASKNDGSVSKAISLFRKIFEADRRTFYGALSKEYFEKATGEKASFFAPPTSECLLLDVGDLKERLSVFKSQELRAFAQAEIDFTFGGMRSDSLNIDYPALLASQSKLSASHGEVSSQIELAEEGLKIGKKSGPRFSCDSELSALAYPSPYLEYYRKAQSINSVSLPLSLAISRSESYFDPEARSPVGAMGLMQLMPETAKLEGWNGKLELTDPETNVLLGVKHLRRLLNNFDGDIYKVAASYNAGAGAVNRWTDRYGIFPSDLFVEFIGYPETNKYVRRVFAAKEVYEEITGEPQK